MEEKEDHLLDDEEKDMIKVYSYAVLSKLSEITWLQFPGFTPDYHILDQTDGLDLDLNFSRGY